MCHLSPVTCHMSLKAQLEISSIQIKRVSKTNGILSTKRGKTVGGGRVYLKVDEQERGVSPGERITRCGNNINLEQVDKPRGRFDKEDFFSIFVGIVGLLRYILDII